MVETLSNIIFLKNTRLIFLIYEINQFIISNVFDYERFINKFANSTKRYFFKEETSTFIQTKLLGV